MSRRHLAAAAGLLALVVLTGCSSQAATPATTTVPSTLATALPTDATPATATPTSTATASPDTETVTDSGYTCKSILSPASLAVFEGDEAAGFTLQDDFIERSRNFGGGLADFSDFGGVLCQWAYPSGDSAVDYGYSELTEAQAATEIQTLKDGGYVEESDDRGTLIVNADAASFTGSYLFTDDSWFYGSTMDILDLVVDNLPAPAN